MRLFNIKGKLVFKQVAKYHIEWDKPSRSIIQFKVKQFLKNYWIGHQCYEEFPVFGSKLKMDLFNATLKIAIEVQGPQHSQFHYFHGGQPINYLNSVKRDCSKLDWAAKNQIKLIEIMYNEVDQLSPAFFLEKFQIAL